VACGHLVRSLVSRWRRRRPSPPVKGCGVDASSYSYYWGRRAGSTFEMRIASAACLLVGNYNIAGHNAYKGLLHGS
jgi:hypothetical protein